MRKFLIAGVLGVAGCAAAVAATPKSVALSNSKLAVSMSDGTNCTADWLANDGAASGVLAGCPYALTYSIQPSENANIVRRGFEQFYQLVGIYDQAVGFGTVEITDASGAVYRFVSP